MASTGNTYPGTGESVARASATAWTNPGNVVSDNTTDATCSSGASGSAYLVARNFGFSLPAGSTIQGVTVRVECSEHSSGGETCSAQLQDDSAALVGSAKTAMVSGTGKAVRTYGSTSDQWGATLTTAIVNDADFGVRFWFTTTHDVRVDYITVAVEYLPPITGTLAKTLDDVAAAAEGSVSDPVVPIEGTADIGFAAATMSAAGQVLVSGSAAVALDDVMQTAAGSLAVAGEASIGLDDLAQAADARLEIAGALASTLGDVSADAAGELGAAPAAGAADISLGDAQLAASGALVITGTAAIVLGDVVVSASTAAAVVEQPATGGDWQPAPFFYRRPEEKGRARITLDDMTMSATGELYGPTINQRQWLTLALVSELEGEYA